MANALFHRFVSGKADGGDATKVQASNWNASMKAAGGTQNQLLMYDPAGDATTLMSWTADPILASIRAPIYDTNADTPMLFKINGTTRWNIGSSGTTYALYPNVDVATDIGTAGFRVRSVYAGTVLTGVVQGYTGATLTMGTVSLQSFYVFTNNINRWIFDSGGSLLANVDNTYDIGTSAGPLRPRDIRIARNYHTDGSVVFTGTSALTADAANQLGLHNGVNAQAFCAYKTYTDNSNYERVSIDTTYAGGVLIETESVGTGTARALNFGAASTARWQITTNGDFVDLNNNRSVQASYLVGGRGSGTPAASGALRLPNAQFVKANNFTGVADVSLIGLDAGNCVVVGGAGSSICLATTIVVVGTADSAAFPAFKRSTTFMEVKLGDDSAYTSVNLLTVNFNLNGNISASSDGVLKLTNNAGTDFTRLQFGGTTNTFPSLKRVGAALQCRLADDSAYGSFAGQDFGMIGKVTTYNNIGTVAWGMHAIYGTGRSAAVTGAVATVATYTVGAVDGSFDVCANVLVTTATTHAFTVTVAYTDENNVARTLTLSFTLVAGGTLVTSVANTNGTVPYMGLTQRIRCKTATTITIATTGTFTTVTYNVEGTITQVA